MKVSAKASESAIEDAFTDFEGALESLLGDSNENASADEDPLAGLDEALSEE